MSVIPKLASGLATAFRARDERGATAAEYGLLVAFIAVVIAVGITAFGGNLNAFFSRIANAIAGWGS